MTSTNGRSTAGGAASFGQARRRGNNWSDPFGPQEILRLDKVMLTANQRDRYGWHVPSHAATTDYLANGEVGLCANDSRTYGKIKKGDVMDIVFAGRPEHTWGFWRNDFGHPETGRGIIDLAYAITIHKSQGSDFGTVIVVLPQGTRLARREARLHSAHSIQDPAGPAASGRQPRLGARPTKP